MLFLLFSSGDGRYALDTATVAEVVHLVRIIRIPQSPHYVAGLINYRGNPIPVIDLCAFLSNVQSCQKRFSTRIIIITYAFTDGGKEFIGLIAEGVVETLKTDQLTNHDSKILFENSVLRKSDDHSSEEMIQHFDIYQMLPEKQVAEIFSKHLIHHA